MIESAVKFITSKIQYECNRAIVLGSGLSDVFEEFDVLHVVPYKDIPGYPKSNVHGHKGELLVVKNQASENVLLVFRGRIHFYEHGHMDKVIFPIRLMAALGVKELTVTNASGAIHPEFTPGELMIISDHINLMGTNPLIGPNKDSLGPRFPDMTLAYSPVLRDKIKHIALNKSIPLREGVYVAISGPSYETPAEINMIRILGGDTVGMSTVPEVIAARHMGIHVLGISLISNKAAGITNQPLNHNEVLEAGNLAKGSLKKLFQNFF